MRKICILLRLTWKKIIIPRGDIVLKFGDVIVLGAAPFDTHEHIRLKEIVIRNKNPWVGVRIRDLDISRHSIIVLIKRRGKNIIPNGDTVMRVGDGVVMYTQLHYSQAREFDI